MGSIEDMIAQAYGELKEGHFEDAIEAFSECLLLEPAEARLYYGRGMAHFRLRQWPDAVSDFSKARELNPGDPETSSALALSLASGNRVYEAIEIFESLLAAHPRYVRAHIQLAQLYYRLGVILKGHRQLELALAARPSNEERQEIDQLKNAQLTMDKRRFYRPDFEELRRQNKTASPSLFDKLKEKLSGKRKKRLHP